MSSPESHVVRVCGLLGTCLWCLSKSYLRSFYGSQLFHNPANGSERRTASDPSIHCEFWWEVSFSNPSLWDFGRRLVGASHFTRLTSKVYEALRARFAGRGVCLNMLWIRDKTYLINQTIRRHQMLTSLPVELRLKIVSLSIGEHVYHVSSILKNGWEDDSETTITHVGHSCCIHSRQRHLSALTSTCRLLYNEAIEILYGQTQIVFTSTEALAAFFKGRDQALQNLGTLSLHCGPGKHLCPSQKRNKRQVFRLLQKHACRLTSIHLCFNPYYGIDEHQQLLSKFWLHNLDRFRGLQKFSMDINLDLMGPIGAVHVSDDMQERIKIGVANMEQILQARLCQPIHEQRP